MLPVNFFNFPKHWLFSNPGLSFLLWNRIHNQRITQFCVCSPESRRNYFFNFSKSFTAKKVMKSHHDTTQQTTQSFGYNRMPVLKLNLMKSVWRSKKYNKVSTSNKNLGKNTWPLLLANMNEYVIFAVNEYVQRSRLRDINLHPIKSQQIHFCERIQKFNIDYHILSNCGTIPCFQLW